MDLLHDSLRWSLILIIIIIIIIIITIGSTHPLRDTNTRNLPGGKGRQARKVDNHTAICEPSV
jgi:hypothetical protein